jgi:hypothetical protein
MRRFVVILEGIVTTLDIDQQPHIAPMGPLVDERISQFVLRPYRSSTTYANLKRLGQGVFHITDDVELMARAAVGRLELLPRLRSAQWVRGSILADACRWYEFNVVSINDRSERTTIACDVVGSGRIRDFCGFNRAKHAVIEAAILATRIGLVSADEIRSEFRRLAVIVKKTAGEQERRAFRFLDEFVAQSLPATTADVS